MRCDVLVLGGGAAGSAAAVACAKAGASVILADRPARRAPIGECLSPQGRPLVRAAWAGFDFAAHPPYIGSRAAWSDDALVGRGFLFDPYGGGLRLDRKAFDAELRAATGAAGVKAIVGATFRCAGGGPGAWDVELRAAAATCRVHAGFVIDCTGRGSAFARTQGVKRIVLDRLIGLVAPGAALDQDNGWLTVEATPFGWWYTVETPEHGRLVVLMTDADIARRLSARTLEGLQRLLSDARHIGRRLSDAWTHAPAIVPACTSRLARVAGAGWCAAGDAAATHDPLSAQGIINALKSGRAAAAAALSGEVSSYAVGANDAFAEYLADRRRVYAANGRWARLCFWRRRTAPRQSGASYPPSST